MLWILVKFDTQITDLHGVPLLEALWNKPYSFVVTPVFSSGSTTFTQLRFRCYWRQYSSTECEFFLCKSVIEQKIGLKGITFLNSWITVYQNKTCKVLQIEWLMTYNRC
jgi:hypothetical protein